MKPIVSIIMGSTSDLPVMEKAAKFFDEMEIPFEINALSAHRTPDAVEEFAKGAKERGIKVIIAGAGMAAALPGVIAASTTLPVIGVPVKGSVLDGVDAVYSMLQMPPGIPVATVAINGALNAGILAVQMLALSDEALAEKFAAEGKIFVGIDGWNWSVGTADVYIIDATEAESATAATEEAAYQAFEDAIRAGITDGGQIHSTNTSITENKSYGYQLLNYFIKTVAVENKIISETTWNQVAHTAQTQYKNDNWYSGDIILSEFDRETGNDFVTDKGNAFELDNTGENKTGAFRQKLQNAADTAAKYADLITKLGASEKKVTAAEEAVKLLKDSIAKLDFVFMRRIIA